MILGQRFWRRTGSTGLGLVVVALATGGCNPGMDAEEQLEGRTSALTISLSTPNDLKTKVGLTGTYALTNDIDMAGQTWTPIGGPFNPFSGTFDGQNHVIKNLTINLDGWYTGMFSFTWGATIQNLGLTNASVTGDGNTGALVGAMVDTRIVHSYVTGTVTALGSGPGTNVPSIGLAVGSMSGVSAVLKSYATGTVTGAAYTIGGFVGTVNGCGSASLAQLSEVFTNVNVSPNTNVDGDVLAGGLVGSASGADIEDISTVGNVTGRNWAGGVVGDFDNASCPSLFTDLLSRGIVTVSNIPNRAGAIGHWDADFIRCGNAYWDTTTDGGSPPTIGGCIQSGYTDTQLKSPHPAPPSPALIWPFIHGGPPVPPQIYGTDGEWGFGYSVDPIVWKLNSSSQHISLINIPNPSVQPL